MKKLISIILTIVLVTSIALVTEIPTLAATENIEEIWIHIPKPIIGEKAKDNFSRMRAYTEDNKGNPTVDSYSWTVKGDKQLSTFGRFEEGVTYYVKIEVKLNDENYFFPRTENIYHEYLGTIHIDGFELGWVYVYGADKKTLVIETSYIDSVQPITDVIVTDLRQPVAGEEPDFEATAISIPENAVDTVNVDWFDSTGNKLRPTSKFNANNEYHPQISLTPKTGYTFNVDIGSSETGVADYSGSVNITDFNVKNKPYANMYKASDTLVIDVEAVSLTVTDITSINITVPKPIVGKTRLDIGSEIAKHFAATPKDSAMYFNSVWTEQESNTTLGYYNKIEEGKKYKICLEIRATDENYQFPCEGEDRHYTGELNVTSPYPVRNYVDKFQERLYIETDFVPAVSEEEKPTDPQPTDPQPTDPQPTNPQPVTTPIKSENLKKTETNITKKNTDKKDVSGSKFSPLCLKVKKTTKSSITLGWTKVKGAEGYYIYGAACGKNMKKLKTVSAKTLNYTLDKLRKGTYYKFLVVAHKTSNGETDIVATSKTVHQTTKGSKYGNPSKVTAKKSAVTLKKKAKYNIKATVKWNSKKYKKHISLLRYESTNKKIATVTAKGKITAKAKGTCYVYAYAQNGAFKKITVKVK